MDERFEFGDIIATRSNSFLSKAIRWFMKKYNPDFFEGDTFSHNAVVINIWGEQWIAEALAWGVRVWTLKDSKYDVKKQVVILRHRGGFTSEEIDAISKKMVSLSGTRYQYENLPMWAIKILTKINLFKPSNEKAIYCSELAAIALNIAHPGTYETPNMVSPLDHLMNEQLDIIDINGIIIPE